MRTGSQKIAASIGSNATLFTRCVGFLGAFGGVSSGPSDSSGRFVFRRRDAHRELSWSHSSQLPPERLNDRSMAEGLLRFLPGEAR